MKHNGELVPEYNSLEPHPGNTGQGRTEDRAPPTKGLPKDPAPQPAEQPAPERKQLATTGSDLIPTLMLAGTLSVIGALLLGARRNRRS